MLALSPSPNLTQNKSVRVFIDSLNPKNSMPHSKFWKITVFWTFSSCNMPSTCFSWIHIAATLEEPSITLFMGSNKVSTWLACCLQYPIVIYPTYPSRSVGLSSCHFSAQNPLITYSPTPIPHWQENVLTPLGPFQLSSHNYTILKSRHFGRSSRARSS